MTVQYEVIVMGKDGREMGDIFALCQDFKWSRTRNDAETVSFQLDEARYEAYLNEINFDEPYDFMEVGRNDLKVKRNGVALLSANLIKFDYDGDQDGSTISVEATGTLNYYKGRYINIDYDDTPQQDILWGVIDACNAAYGGDYGVRLGTHTGATINRDRHQTFKEVKSFFQQMSQVLDGLDFEFDAEKKLNTFIAQGSYRPDVRLNFPGNIASYSFSRSVEAVANAVYGFGSGNGEDAIQAVSEDLASQIYMYRREKPVTYNSIEQVDTLQQNIDAVLHYGKLPVELPSVTLQPGTLDLNTVGIGDTLPINMTGRKSLKHINGNYRIESITCAVDQNTSESVSLTFDDIDINSIIATQEAQDGGE